MIRAHEVDPIIICLYSQTILKKEVENNNESYDKSNLIVCFD